MDRAAIVQRLGIVRPERNRPVVACQRFVGPLELVEHDAAIVVCVGQVGLERDGALVWASASVSRPSPLSATPQLACATAEFGSACKAASNWATAAVSSPR